MIDISVVIPAHNEEKYIGAALDSLKRQSFRDFEVIVVCNGCNDRTYNIARKYTDRVLSIPRANVCAARNIGAENANGEIIVFMDADTFLEENALSEIKKQFSLRHAIGTMFLVPNHPKTRYKLLFFLKNLFNRVYTASSHVIISRKELFNKCRGFNQDIEFGFENRDFALRIARFGEYTVIKKTWAVTSTRRYEAWGLLKTALFWLGNKLFLVKAGNVDYGNVR